METHSFKLSTNTKGQLALLYFPDQSKKTAMQSFRRLIIRYSCLNEELQKTDFFTSYHTLTPFQIEIIFKHLGNPNDFVYRRSFDEKRKNLTYGIA